MPVPMDGRQTKWVATVSGKGMGTSHLEADTRDALETQLGDLQGMHLGRVRWTVEERAADWTCDGQDGCPEAERDREPTPVAERDRKPAPVADQLGLDL
jgi:hypothetical protein